MYSSAEVELTYKFANAPILGFPYPHFFIQDVFPQDFYDRLQASIPDPSVMIPIEEASLAECQKRPGQDLGG